MPMEVTEKQYLSTLLNALHQLLGGEYWSVLDFVWIFPISVQIEARKVASVVSINDTIWIKHWNKNEVKSLTQSLCYIRIAQKMLNYALHYPAAVAFTRMDSSCEKDARP